MSKRNEEFYIGWKDKLSKPHAKWLSVRILFVIAMLLAMIMVLVVFEKPANDFVFDYANPKEVTGVFYANPVPMIALDATEEKGLEAMNALLVGAGKMGADQIIQELEQNNGSLDKKRLTLRGTLIYGDGKIILELTDGLESLLWLDSTKLNRVGNYKTYTDIELSGEIIDPKCYFGAMKPGEGKIHKSCAIRCISGGIPPVFKVDLNDVERDYYLLLGANGEKINQEILTLVGEKIRLKGRWRLENGWKVLRINMDELP